MKTSMMKKTAAFAASVLMTAALAAQASAATTKTPTSGTAPAQIITAAETADFTIPKDILLFNVDSENIYEPNIAYTYTVAAAEVAAGTTVTGKTLDTTDDEDKVVSVAVRGGVAGVVTIKGADGSGPAGEAGASAKLTFGDTDATFASNAESDDGTAAITKDSNKATRALTVYIDASKFAATDTAGIYRYIISDTTDAADLTKAGVERSSDYDAVRYLDVYTQYDADGKLQVYGYVLFKGNAGADTSFEYDAAADKETTKVSGYDLPSENGTDGEYNAENGTKINSDEYHTFNLEITKTITGALANKNHQFPFAVALSNDTVTSKDEFTYSVSGGAPTPAALSESGAYTFADLKFKDGEGIKIIGLPAGTTANIAETNDTVDYYTASAVCNNTADNTELLAATLVNPGADQTIKDSYAVNLKTAGDKIDVTNTLDAVSPTGLIFRIAPFVIMLAAAGILIAVFMKNRKHDAADSVL